MVSRRGEDLRRFIFPIAKQGRFAYNMEDGREHHNGLTEIYVNTAVRDTSTPAKEAIAELMQIFVDSDAYDYQRFPHFSERKDQFKNHQEGAMDVSEELAMLIDKEVNKEAQRIKQEQIDRSISKMLSLGMDISVIADVQGVSEDYVLSFRDRLTAA